MTPESYNHARIVSGDLSAFDVQFLTLWFRFPGPSEKRSRNDHPDLCAITRAVRVVQRQHGLVEDGRCGPLTTAELPTRKLRCDAESLIALALHATAGREYVFGCEVTWPDCRLLTWGEAAAALRPVKAWDCSELIEVCSRMLGIKVAGVPLMDGTWRQYRQLAEAHRNIYLHDAEPGDLVFEFRNDAGKRVTPGDRRPARAHVGIILNWQHDTIEAAPGGCGPYPARKTWTHAARLLP